MKIRLFSVSIACVLVCLSWAGLSPSEFQSFIEDTCFEPAEEESPFQENQERKVNGQEHPLSSTLENFIALAEKLELANPTLDLKDELFYFIRNYTYNHLEYNYLGDIEPWKPANHRSDELDMLWESNEALRTQLPQVVDPFSDGEKCSLFFSISYSIVRTHRTKNAMRSATNDTKTWKANGRQFKPADLYPLELGVVSVLGTESSVSLGKILNGLYLGLQKSRRRTIEEFPKVTSDMIPKDSEKIVDPLYTLTVAEVLALSTWRPEAGKREKMAADGEWLSIPIGNDRMDNTKEVCPMIYKLPNNSSQAFSYNALRGAADGLILGKVIDSVYTSKRDVKLSQVLRMYFSRGGLVGQADDQSTTLRASFCNRDSILSQLEQDITDQVRLYIILAGSAARTLDGSVSYAMTYYKEIKSTVFGDSFFRKNSKISDYCRTELSIDKPENWPIESSLDVIAVMDSSFGQDTFMRQQLILGYVSRALELRSAGSRMTILTDHRISPSQTAPASVLLKPVVDDTYSSACAACAVTQITFDNEAGAPEDEVIAAVNQLLHAKKDNETRRNGVNGKVVVYFNFQEDEQTARPTALQSRITQALTELHVTHRDTVIFALGRSPDVLKKYARGDTKFVLVASDSSEKEVAEELFKKLSEVPALLQYTDCEDGRSENSAVMEDFVSPSTVQHWEMPAKYFHKSRNIKLTFESQFPIRVCHSRATTKPELQEKSCQDVSNGNKAEFKHSNPCKGFTPEACSPFYFSVLGVNETDPTVRREYCQDNTNSENKCRTLDQLKFRVLHEGIRCSGCLNLIASTVVIWCGIIFARLF